jgi:hypothetical protein
MSPKAMGEFILRLPMNSVWSIRMSLARTSAQGHLSSRQLCTPDVYAALLSVVDAQHFR